MPIVNPTAPTIGQPNSTEDIDVLGLALYGTN
jgi:hypothetical protein